MKKPRPDIFIFIIIIVVIIITLTLTLTLTLTIQRGPQATVSLQDRTGHGIAVRTGQATVCKREPVCKTGGRGKGERAFNVNNNNNNNNNNTFFLFLKNGKKKGGLLPP